MINKKKLIFLDLDGTLLDDESHISNFTRNVLLKVQDMGHEVAISTGRNWLISKKQYNHINLKSIISNYNGALIHLPRDRTFEIRRRCLSPILVNEILNDDQVKNNLNNSISFFPNHRAEMFHLDEQVAKNDYWISPLRYLKQMDKEQMLVESPYATYITLNCSYEQAQGIIEYLRQKFINSLTFQLWSVKKSELKDQKFTFEVNAKGVNKSFALKSVSRYYNISLDDTIAFGNDSNDISMLITSGIGVAIKNASEEVKLHSDQTTIYDNNNDGVARWLVNYFNLKEFKDSE